MMEAKNRKIEQKGFKAFIGSNLFKSSYHQHQATKVDTKQSSLCKFSLNMQLLRNESAHIKDLVDFAEEKVTEAA